MQDNPIVKAAILIVTTVVVIVAILVPVGVVLALGTALALGGTNRVGVALIVIAMLGAIALAVWVAYGKLRK
jgi:hypothetical protein